MKRGACYNTDPSRWFRILTSITNTTIADKITRSEFLPQNLQQCFEKALRLEASLQLSEGVNMAWKTTVMNVEVDTDDEVNLIKDVRARSNACYKCGEMGHFQRDCKYDGDKPMDGPQEQEGFLWSSCGKMDDQFSGHHTHYSKGNEKFICQIKQAERP